MSIGRSGRAGRNGKAITLYTEEDVPFLRNIANVMQASGCEVPSWILSLPKLRKKKHRPLREPISTRPDENPEATPRLGQRGIVNKFSHRPKTIRKEEGDSKAVNDD